MASGAWVAARIARVHSAKMRSFVGPLPGRAGPEIRARARASQGPRGVARALVGPRRLGCRAPQSRLLRALVSLRHRATYAFRRMTLDLRPRAYSLATRLL